jgi:flagellar FliL protein
MPDDRNAGAKAPSANAKDAGKGTPADGAKPAKKKNPKLLVLGGVVAALLIVAGAAGWFLTRPKAEDGAPAADAKGAAAKGEKGEKGDKAAKGKDKDKKAEGKKPVFVDLDMITVNLKDPEKFLQIKLTFQLRNPDAVEPLKELMPMLRNAVIPVLGAQDAAELMTPEGKEKLAAQVVDAANKALAPTEVADAIDTVLITHMIIQ